MAYGECFQRLHYNLRVGTTHVSTTAGKTISKTYNAIWKLLLSQSMPLPTTEDWIKIANGFEKCWNFPNCLGAIDKNHIAIQCQPNSGSRYFNYKEHDSIILQAVVDANAKFIFIDIEDFVRNSDGGVFQRNQILEND